MTSQPEVELLTELKEVYKQIARKEAETSEKVETLMAETSKKVETLTAEKHSLELTTQRLINELANKNADYLRICRSLHVRCVFKSFEMSRPILKNANVTRFNRWQELIHSNDPAVQDVKDAIVKHALDMNIVPRVASSLFQKINADVHKDFGVSRNKLLVVMKYFSPDELKLVKIIVECYPLADTDVEYIN